MTCDKHKKEPAWGYSECAGCEVERLKAELTRLRAANAELVEALKAGLELMPLGTAKRADWLVKAGNIISLSRAEQPKPEVKK